MENKKELTAGEVAQISGGRVYQNEDGKWFFNLLPSIKFGETIKTTNGEEISVPPGTKFYDTKEKADAAEKEELERMLKTINGST